MLVAVLMQVLRFAVFLLVALFMMRLRVVVTIRFFREGRLTPLGAPSVPTLAAQMVPATMGSRSTSRLIVNHAVAVVLGEKIIGTASHLG